VSPAVPSSDAEIDLGRWAHRILSRWYIVVACVVVAVVIALLGEGHGKKEWTARALVNLGQPYTSSNTPIAASLGTNPSAAGTILKQDAIVKLVAAKVGLRPAQLKAAISTQPVGQVNVKVNYTPLVNVIVRGPWRTRVSPAANLLAQQLVKATGRYQLVRLNSVKRLVGLEARQLAVLAQRNTVAVNNYKAIASAPGLSAVERALALNSASGLLNTIETRQSTLQAQHTEDLQTLAQVQNIEMPTIVTRGVATQTTAASKRAGYSVAILLGLIVGVLLALLSYAAWPDRPREEAPKPNAT
jgi:ABC-type Na+ efflux pump permease subunit